MGAGLLLRALLKRPRRAAAIAGGPPLTSAFVLPPPRRAEVEAYNAALGFAAGATPLTWWYLPVQRAHLVTMFSRDFPFRIAGMVHVENALALHAPPPGGPLQLATRIEILSPGASGAVLCRLDTVATSAGTTVLTCSSTYLAVRGQRKRAPAAMPPQPPQPRREIGRWRLSPSAGRDYARVSGDWNPIHLALWSARLMGLRAPIIHGMHTLGRACALLEADAGRPVSAISVRFRAPVALGATVALAEGTAPGDYLVLADGVPAAEGRAAFGPAR